MRTPSPLLIALVFAACGGEGGGGEPAEEIPDAAPDATGAAPDPADADPDPDAAPAFDSGLPPSFDAAPPEADADPTPDIARRLSITVNEIPQNMLGYEPATFEGHLSEFHWAVPPTDWTLEVDVGHGGAWTPEEPPYVLWRGVSVVIDRHVIDPATLDPPGGRWTRTDDGHRWQARIAEPLPGGPGGFTLQTAVADLVTPALKIEIAERTPEIDPFEEIDDWLLHFDRDRGALEIDFDGRDFTVRTAHPGEPNGVPDFEEAVAAVGLLGGDEAWRAEVIGRVRAQMRAHMRTFFLQDAETGALDEDSVRLRVHFDDDPDLPPREEWAGLGWSHLAVGGDDPEYQPGGRTFFGRAAIDWNNTRPDDNTAPDRGVFTTSFVRFALTNLATRALLQPYVPAADGATFGSLPGDAAFLAPDFDPSSLPRDQITRGARFKLVFDYLSLAMASVTTHEMGHSLGLVKPGLPPTGLLADVEGPWVAAPVSGGHIDTPGFNIMQSGSSFSITDVASGLPRFNEPNRAYLRRRILVLPE